MDELPEIALVFGRLGLLAFGGGIAILPEIERQVVVEHGWITRREFVDSFALGRLTPGPGMLMVMFTGYKVAGIPGALTALIAIFGPTALITAVVAAYWDRLRQRPWLATLQRALAPVALGLLAAGGFTLLRSAVQDVIGAVIAIVTLVVLWVWHPNPAWVVVVSGVVGAVAYGLTG